MSITGTISEQIQKAINAHGVWKVKLAQAVESGTVEMAPEEARRHDQCRLGQWLYGQLDPALATSPRYQTVKELHFQFHQAAAEIVAMSLARKRTDALEAMEFGSTFKQASARLVIELTAWGDEAGGGARGDGGEGGI
jgi:hypothetical protein